ncbi:MAG: alpha/beta hydrolase [Planctomycetota bacterium]
MSSVIWKSEAGRQRLTRQYDVFLAKLRSEASVKEVDTRFGSGTVLTLGPEDAPRIVCLHAMRTGAPMLLSELLKLSETARLIVPDLPGQSVRGANVRLSLHDESYAHWLADVMDVMRLESARIFGVSWGGWVGRMMANTYADRVEKLALLVPAGIVRGSVFGQLLKMTPKLIRYRFSPTRPNLETLIEPLATELDDAWLDFMHTATNDWKVDPRLPPLASDERLRAIKCPVFAIAADNDISFPGQALLERIAETLPSAKRELIRDCKHCPPTTEEFRSWLCDVLMKFFA